MDNWELFGHAIKCYDRIYLSGPPGVGKTYSARHALGDPVEISLTEDHCVQELIGHFVPDGDRFRWHDGPIAEAIRASRPLLINELARASGAVLDLMLAVLDSPVRITLPTRETVECKSLKVIATANSPISQLDPALQDRFQCVLEVAIPAPGAILALDRAKKGLGKVVRDSYADPRRAVSVRQALAWASGSQLLGLEMASQAVFGSADFANLFLIANQK